MNPLRRGLTPFLCLTLLFGGMPATASAGPDRSSPLREAVTAETRRPAAPRLPRDSFLTPSNLADVALSPDGRRVAFLRRHKADRSLWLLGTAGGAPRMLVRHSEAVRLHWSADGAWLFLESPRQLFAMSIDSRPGSGVMTLFGGRQSRRLLGADPIAPAAILVTEEVRRAGASRPSEWRLLRLAPARPAQVLLRSRSEIAAFVPDRQGRGFVKLVEGEGHSIHRVERDGRTRELLRCVGLEQCAPLSSPAAGELVLSGDVGGDLERLLRLDARGRLSPVHQDPAGRADLAEAVIDPVSGEPLAAAYRSMKPETHPLTASMGLHLASIGQGLAGSDFRLAVGRGPGARWLVAETDDRLQHARWHVYDPATGRLREVLADVEASARRVPANGAARRLPFSYRASDGMLLHGFLAVPAGADPARTPLVVQVHGGPWSHVSAGYSTLTQFLVNRGYAVFEPNFRGSTGHGRAYASAGGGDFGNGRVQQDVVEGTQFLLGQGIGDPQRVGISGTSFGGYSALLGATFAPETFRVAIAAMPPSDFGWVLRWQLAREQARGHSGLGLAASLRAMGFDPRSPHLSSQSPMANLARLKRPVLLVGGGLDESVPIRSIVDYAARLRSLGRDVSLFVDPRSGHRMEAPETQEIYLYLIERMLGANLAGPLPAPLAGDLRRTLDGNLRLRGRAFGPAGKDQVVAMRARPSVAS